MQMLTGGVMLAIVAAATGEVTRIHDVSATSILALVYLITIGSWLAFTTYAWLLRATRTSLVSTYAYVNPVVAVLLGWAILSEPITGRVLFASAVIVAAVALIVTARTMPERLPPPTDAGPFEGPEAVARVPAEGPSAEPPS